MSYGCAYFLVPNGYSGGKRKLLPSPVPRLPGPSAHQPISQSANPFPWVLPLP